MLKAAELKHKFVWLEPPASLGSVTVADVAETRSALEHKNAVSAWAKSAWAAWSPHHGTIQKWLPCPTLRCT
jgi:hypothetical protein